MKRKYFKTLAAARKACEERRKGGDSLCGVYRMPKGSRHAGEYAVCDYLEYLNTY